VDELSSNHGLYDLAKMAKYATMFAYGRARRLPALIDDPYLVFAAAWLAATVDCQVVLLVRHPAGVVSSLARIGTGWSDSLPDIAAQPELIEAYFPDQADELQKAAREPLDVVRHGALLWRLIHHAISKQLDENPAFILVRYEGSRGRPADRLLAALPAAWT
jgi:hypothetical protein